MSNREAFLARVRQSAEQGRQHCIHSRPISEEVGYVGAGGDLVERFALEVIAVGGEAFVVSDLAATGEQLRRLLVECQAQSAICWRHELLERVGLSDLLAAANVKA